MNELWIRNRQRRHPVSLGRLREVTRHLLEKELRLESYQLGIQLVGRRTMAEVNEHYLGHEGATDVITFDHAGPGLPLYGELFICPAVAARQGADYRTGTTAELVRYVVHGVLHLRGHDDTSPAPRRRMKRQENRLMRRLRDVFPLSDSMGRG